jgi:hypothetical protein
MLAVPVEEETLNFSPMPLRAPPPSGRLIAANPSRSEEPGLAKEVAPSAALPVNATGRYIAGC